jgi:UDP-glucose 4-epimerase
VLVAGGGGFLGSAIAQACLARGDEVITIGLGAPATLSARLHHHEGLLTRALLSSAKAQHGPADVIVHAAGGASVGRSWEDPRGDFELSVGSTVEILDFIRSEAPATKLLLISSAAVYGDHGGALLSEDSACRPVSPYGLHKRVCEELVLGEARMNGLAASIVRLFSIYGEGLRKQILWDMLVRARKEPGKELELWGSGDESRDFLHAEDATRLLLRAAQEAVPGKVGIFNGASGTPVTVAALAKELLRAARLGQALVFNGRVRSGDPIHLLADVHRTHTQLGFSPKIELREGLARYAGWFYEQG